MIAVVVVSLALAAMYWWVAVRTSPPTSAHWTNDPAPATASAPAQEAIAAPAAAPVAVPAPVQLAEVAPPPKPEPGKAEPVKVEPAKAQVAKSDGSKADVAKALAIPPAEAATKVAAKPVEGGAVLKFRFHGDSWVEIRDGKGKVLLSRLNTGGSETEVAGKPPFSVIVGNAPEVRLYYNDREFDLEPHTRVAVARFTVE